MRYLVTVSTIAEEVATVMIDGIAESVPFPDGYIRTWLADEEQYTQVLAALGGTPDAEMLLTREQVSQELNAAASRTDLPPVLLRDDVDI